MYANEENDLDVENLPRRKENEATGGRCSFRCKINDILRKETGTSILFTPPDLLTPIRLQLCLDN